MLFRSKALHIVTKIHVQLMFLLKFVCFFYAGTSLRLEADYPFDLAICLFSFVCHVET